MATIETDNRTQMLEAEAELFTRNGDRIRVRPAQATDRSTIADFFGKTSPDDRRFRFLAAVREVDAARIDQLCRADYPEAFTFLAFHGEELVAIATLTGDRSGRAEVALVTLPAWKAHGISWTLLDHAIRFAREHGAKEILSIEHGDNHAAISLEHEMGFGIRLMDAGTGEVMAVKSVG